MIRKTLDYTTTKEDEPYRIRTILRMRLGVSARFLRSCRNDGDILRNGEHIRTVDRVTAGDVLTLVFPETAPPADVPPEDIPIDVLYEDADFLAVRKPPGIPVHPSKGHPSGTLLNGIVRRIVCDAEEERPELYEPHLVNRLDKDTSGIVLVGKNAYVQEAFAELAKRGGVEKEYLAIVRGVPDPREGTIDLPIGQPDPALVRRAVIPESEGGYHSRTRYRTLRTFRVPADPLGNAMETAANAQRSDAAETCRTVSLLACTLETGRTHQIRVHLSAIGCPIVGDPLYGESPGGRQLLSAVRLAFDHPVTRKRVLIEAEPDDDMKRMIQKLEQISIQTDKTERMPFVKTGNIRRVTAGRGGEALLIFGDEKVALYDSGMACFGQGLLENIRRELNGRALDYFIVSHIHYDHIGALPYVLRAYPDITVIGHEHAQRQITKPHKYAQIRELSEEAAKTFLGPDATIPLYDDSVWRVDRVVRDGDRIDLGGVTLRVLETPGHTKDCLAFYVPEWDLLIASETTGVWEAEGVNVVEFLTGYEDSIRAFERCRAIGASHVLSPHMLELLPEEIPLYWERGLDFLRRLRADIEREVAIPDITDEQRIADLAAIYWVGTTREEQPYPAFVANATAQLYQIRKLNGLPTDTHA